MFGFEFGNRTSPAWFFNLFFFRRSVLLLRDCFDYSTSLAFSSSSFFVTHDIVPSIFSRFLSPNIIMLVYTYILNGICVCFTLSLNSATVLPVRKVSTHTATALLYVAQEKEWKKKKKWWKGAGKIVFARTHPTKTTSDDKYGFSFGTMNVYVYV